MHYEKASNFNYDLQNPKIFIKMRKYFWNFTDYVDMTNRNNKEVQKFQVCDKQNQIPFLYNKLPQRWEQFSIFFWSIHFSQKLLGKRDKPAAGLFVVKVLSIKIIKILNCLSKNSVKNIKKASNQASVFLKYSPLMFHPN